MRLATYCNLIIQLIILILFTFQIAKADNMPHDQRLEVFMKEYTNPVYEMLSIIHNHPMTYADRYIILGSQKDDRKYVQCIFVDNDTVIQCEAASGMLQSQELPTLEFSSQQRDALEKQGLSMNVTNSNFTIEFPVQGEQTLKNVATWLVKTIYVGYDVKLHDLIVDAHFIACENNTDFKSCSKRKDIKSCPITQPLHTCTKEQGNMSSEY